MGKDVFEDAMGTMSGFEMGPDGKVTPAKPKT